MKRRSRMRGPGKWAGLIVCSVLLIGYLATLRWSRIAVYLGPAEVGLSCGRLYVYFDNSPDRFVPVYCVCDDFASWSEWFGFLSAGLLPSYRSVGQGYYWGANCPLWIPFILVGLPTAWLWYADRRRPAPGACRCGYDLTGNTSGRCPECGSQT